MGATVPAWAFWLVVVVAGLSQWIQLIYLNQILGNAELARRHAGAAQRMLAIKTNQPPADPSV